MSKLLHSNMNQIQFDLRSNGSMPRDVATAAHEAAHAIVAMSLGFRVTDLYADFRHPLPGGYEGQCRWDDTDANDTETALVLAAGWQSLDFLESGVRYTSGHRTDWPEGGDLEELRAALGSSGFVESVAKVGKAAHSILKDHRHAFDALATALLIHTRLSEAEIAYVVGNGLAHRWQTRSTRIRQTTAGTSRRSLPNVNTMTPAQRHKIADALEKLITAQARVQASRPAAPGYRVGNATVETRELIPGLRYGDTMEVRRR